MPTTSDRPTAVLTIPVAYLEDVRRALVTQVADDSRSLLSNRDAQTDRAVSTHLVISSVSLLAELLEFEGPSGPGSKSICVAGPEELADAHADRDTLADMLQATIRVIVDRLDNARGYYPIDMEEVLELAEELRWAASESARILDEEVA